MELASQDANLKAMICGAIKRQSKLVINNRYANAFNYDFTGDGHRSDEVHTTPAATYCDQVPLVLVWLIRAYFRDLCLKTNMSLTVWLMFSSSQMPIITIRKTSTA